MELRLFHFSKRKNSTKIPSDSSATTVRNVRMKQETSVINPSFILKDIDLKANYCKWNNNYYFINDMILADDDMYQINCTIDALGTARSGILNTTANVMYAQNSDKNIIDSRIPVTADVELTENIKALSDVTIVDSTMGAVILGLTGKGSFGSYLLSSSSKVAELLDGVDDWFGENVSGVMDAWKQLIHGGSAAECLKSAIALPLLIFGPDVSSTGAENITLGAYPCKDDNKNYITGYKITSPLLFDTTKISIPWKYSDWRRNPPYTQVIVYLPFVGLINLPTTDVINDSELSIQYAFNVTSGDFSVQIVGVQSGRIFSTSSGNIAMNTAYGSTGIDTNKLTTSIVAGAGAIIAGTASAIASGGLTLPAALGIAGGMATAAGGTMSALGGTGSGNGGLGGGSSQGLDKVIHVYCVNRNLTDSQERLNPIMGKPFLGVSTISSFRGFIQTQGFSLSGNYLEPIITSVNSMMDSGVYIE